MRTVKAETGFLTAVVIGLTAVNLQAAEGPNAVVEASLLSEGDLSLKQRCELVVRFPSDGVAFAHAPQFPSAEIPEAIVVPPRSGLNMTERRGGDTWIGVQRSYAVFPRKAGLLEVPAITVTGRVRSGSSVTEVDATSEAFQREVVVPDEFSGRPDIVVTSDLRIEQGLDPQQTVFKVGDALKRTLTVTASDTVSMLLPVIKAPEVDGTSVYPEQAALDDRDQRGVISASRVDSGTYIMEREGEYTLPELTVHWWNPRSKEVQVAIVPELEFRVVPNPDFTQPHLLKELVS